MKLGWTCLFLLGFTLVIGQNLNVPLDPTTDLVTPSLVPDTDCGENFPFQSVRAMAEWEEIESIVISWDGYPQILSDIVEAALPEGRVIILAQNTATAKNDLNDNGINYEVSNIDFVPVPINSLWVRDYGPNTVYRNGVNERHFVDWLYNRNRPQDDVAAQSIAEEVQSPLHCLTKAPTDLVHTGGNFMCDGMGTGFSSKIILDENGPNNEIGVSNHTEEDIDAIMFESMGIHNYIKMDTLPYDLIHHMDMHMKLIDEETLIVGEYPVGVADGPQIEANLKYIQDNFTAPSGNPYRVIRIPMPSSKNNEEVYPPEGDYRTYTNALILNKSILLPTYGIPMDQTAIDIWQNAMPGYKIKGIDCNGLVSKTGAIHCVTKEIGVAQPLWIGHAKPWSACNNNSNKFVAQADHYAGIEFVNMKYWTNSNPLDVKELAMTLKVGENYEVEFPAIEDDAETIYYYFEAEAKNGKFIRRPMTAPEGYFKLPITKCLSSLDRTLPLQNQWSVFPNPAIDQLSIKIEGKNLIGDYEVTLMNSLGEIFNQKSVQDSSSEFINITLDLSGLTTGIYFVSIANETGRGTKKVFINRP